MVGEEPKNISYQYSSNQINDTCKWVITVSVDYFEYVVRLDVIEVNKTTCTSGE